MKSTSITLLILVVLLLGACKTSKKVETTPPAPQPEWVKSRPTSSTHYIGIGWARKTVDVNQYQQTAKQNALADLAGEISVNVSSNSVLYAFESNKTFREDYMSTIRTETQEELEAFEVIDTWEDQTSYWLYYRLSKAEHQRLKELKKANAVSRSLNLLEKGVDAQNNANIRMALVHYIQALEPIKSYFNEPLTADLRGKSIFLGNEIFGNLSSLLSSISIEPLKKETQVKTGSGLTFQQLMFTINSKSAEPVYELPMIATYSERPIRNNQKRTDNNGVVAFSVDVVRSSNAYETFTVSTDLDALIIEATADQFIRKLVNRLPKPEGSIQIIIQKPVLHIESTESILGEKTRTNLLKDALLKKAIEAGYRVEESKSISDYTIQITSNTVKQVDSGAYKNVILKCQVLVKNHQGNQIYFKQLDEIKGTHFDFKQASDEAYNEARRRIDVSVFREIDEAIKKGGS